MSKQVDPLAIPKGLWRTFGAVVASSPLVSRSDIDQMHRVFETQSIALEHVNPQLAKISGDLAAEFYGSALDALSKRENPNA